MKVDFFRTISTIVEADVSPTAKSVMVCLLNYRNSKTGACYPSITTISEGAGAKVTSIKTALFDLKEAGLISWESKVPRFGNAKTNHYKLLFMWPLNDHMSDRMSGSMGNQTGDRSSNQTGDRSESDHEPTGTNRNQQEPKKHPPLSAEGVQKEFNDFEKFWDQYGKKTDRKTTLSRWKKLSQKDKDLIFQTLPAYLSATPDIQYRRGPAVYLNKETWKDEAYQKSTPPIEQLLPSVKDRMDEY